MKYKYTPVLGLYGETIYRPIIKVEFINLDKSVISFGLLDSGSDYLIIPDSLACRLNLTTSWQTEKRLAAANGQTFAVRRSNEKVKIKLGEEIGLESFVYIADCEEQILLGQKGFLENLRVGLDAKYKRIELTP